MKTELILEIIQERWSPYALSAVPIEEFKLKAMFEAARFAPSGNNEQPWIFVYTTRENIPVFNSFIEFMNDSNRIWAKEAYALIIVMCRTRYRKTNNLNRRAVYDTGMAVMNLLLQALAFDIYVHQAGGYSDEKVKEYFKLDDSIEPLTIMAAGYLGNGESLPPEILRQDEERRPRRQVNEYTFRDSLWNQAFVTG